MNVLFRILGIILTGGSVAAISIAVYDGFTSDAAEGAMPFIGIVIVAFLFGVTLLRMRTFRPDMPDLGKGKSVKWWTGDPT